MAVEVDLMAAGVVATVAAAVATLLVEEVTAVATVVAGALATARTKCARLNDEQIWVVLTFEF